MVKAVFDSNILIDFLQGRPEAKRELERYDDRAISVLTWIEVMVGTTPETNLATRAYLSGFELIPLDEHIAETAVELRRRHRMKLPDAIIWASARRDGRLLVTRDTKDFPLDDPGVRAPYSL